VVIVSTPPVWRGVGIFVGLRGMSFSRSILLPSFASLSASSLPMMLVCALTLCRVVRASRSFRSFTIKANMVLSGWLFCCAECFIWVFMRYRELRLSVKICTGSCGNSWLSMSSVWYIADISALSIFCSPISLLDIFILRSGFQMPYLALAGFHIFSESFLEGVNDLYSSKIVVGIFGVGFLGSLVIGMGCFDLYLWGVMFYSIWGVYAL
jgi:hypothetical protein